MNKAARIPDCDICKHEDGVVNPATHDGKTKYGPWAFMCDAHLKSVGTSIHTKLGAKA
jgi:hypothetical protein